jgi:type IV pilus assembly protein PilV
MKNAKGFTLIEVLVSTLVLTVGILGVAGMQMVSFQTNQSAYARSQAVYLAQDMFDRMRANPDGYDSTTVYDTLDSDTSSSIPSAPDCVTTAAGCSATQMAQQDLREWAGNFVNVFSLTSYRPMLPIGRGVIARTGSSNEFTITVSWSERDWDSGGTGSRTMNARSVSLVATLN